MTKHKSRSKLRTTPPDTKNQKTTLWKKGNVRPNLLKLASKLTFSVDPEDTQAQIKYLIPLCEPKCLGRKKEAQLATFNPVSALFSVNIIPE